MNTRSASTKSNGKVCTTNGSKCISTPFTNESVPSNKILKKLCVYIKKYSDEKKIENDFIKNPKILLTASSFLLMALKEEPSDSNGSQATVVSTLNDDVLKDIASATKVSLTRVREICSSILKRRKLLLTLAKNEYFYNANGIVNKNIDECSYMMMPVQLTETCWFNVIIVCLFFSQYTRMLIRRQSKEWDKENEVFNKLNKILYSYKQPRNSKEYVKYLSDLSNDSLLLDLYNTCPFTFDFDPTKQSKHHSIKYVHKILSFLGLKYAVLVKKDDDLYSFNNIELTSNVFKSIYR